MSTTLDEQDRQKKQAEMIRQYLQITNIDSNPQPINNSSANISSGPKETQTNLPVGSSTSTDISSTKMKKIEFGTLSLDLNELRREIEQTEERVERLRQEVKDLQKKREENVLRSPPASLFISFPSSINRRLNDRTTPPASLTDFQRPMINKDLSEFSLPNWNFLGRHSMTTDFFKDERHRQFLWTMQQHREQLLVYLDSLKRALASLDRLASLEPSRRELHLTNMKTETIQEKSRQLQALKSTRSAQHSPFIECRIRQLERDLIHMLSEHQKDVQTKLELNEQRSLMLIKITQVNDELAALDQQIHQILPNSLVDLNRVNPSSSSSSSSTTTAPEYNLHPLNKLPHIFQLHGN